jgi:hypothetical protein
VENKTPNPDVKASAPARWARIVIWLGIYLIGCLLLVGEVARQNGGPPLSLQMLGLSGLFPTMLIYILPNFLWPEPWWAVVLFYGRYVAHLVWILRVQKRVTFVIAMALLAILIGLNIFGYFRWNADLMANFPVPD